MTLNKKILSMITAALIVMTLALAAFFSGRKAPQLQHSAVAVPQAGPARCASEDQNCDPRTKAARLYADYEIRNRHAGHE